MGFVNQIALAWRSTFQALSSHKSLHHRRVFLLVVLGCMMLMSGEGHAQTLQLDPARILSPLQPTPAPAVVQAEMPMVYEGYLYLEANQMRFEVLLDAASALRLVGQPDPIVLKEKEKAALQQALKEKALDWCHLGVQRPAKGEFKGATIIKGKPGATLPLADEETVGTHEAMVGLLWVFPLPPRADQFQLKWSGYFEKNQRLKVQVFDPRMRALETVEAQASEAITKWRLKKALPLPPPLTAVPQMEAPAYVKVPVASAIWLGTGGLLLWLTLRKGKRLPGGMVTFLSAWLVGGLFMWPLFVMKVPLGGKVPQVETKEEAESILSPLLRNVYRAFDFREEKEIYDTLARSVDGELLRKLYLETQEALTLEGREDTRVTVSEFSAEVSEVQPAANGRGFTASCQWTALGTVGHWGHTHTRVNRYTAKVTIAAVEREWKIIGLDVEEARRL